MFGMRMWAATYYCDHEEEIGRNELQQKKVFDDLNVLMRKVFPEESKKVAKGAFPAFASDNTNNDEGDGNESASERSSSEPQQTRARSRSPTRARSRSPTRARSRSPKPHGRAPKGRKRHSSDRGPTYKVCNGGSHPIVRCYYVFPENAPAYVKLRADLLARAKERLAADKKLHEEVERCQKRVKKEEPRKGILKGGSPARVHFDDTDNSSRED